MESSTASASQDPVDRFTIFYNGTEIPISKFKFALYSLRFRRISGFGTATQLHVTGEHSLSTFETFLRGAQGFQIEVTHANSVDLLDLCSEWETPTLHSVILNFVSKSPNCELICDKVGRQASDPGLERILSEHINEAMNFPSFRTFPLNTLQRILSSATSLDPHSHCRFVLEMLGRCGEAASVLALGLNIRELTAREAEDLLTAPQMVAGFVNDSLAATTVTLLRENEQIIDRLRAAEGALERVLARVDALEQRAIDPSIHGRLEELAGRVRKADEEGTTSLHAAEKKWHLDLRKTNKTVNGCVRKAGEVDEQLRTLNRDHTKASNAIADLTRQTQELREAVMEVQESSRVMRTIDCGFGGRSFAGILSRMAGDQKMQTVKVTASTSDHNDARHVADMEWTDVWFTENMPNQWVMYDFGDSRVTLSHYTIKTHKFPAGTCHLKAWVVEVSRDGRNWTELDKRNISLLNGPSRFQTFPCAKPGKKCRYVRLRQTATNSRGDNILALTNFELFGLLFMPEE